MSADILKMPNTNYLEAIEKALIRGDLSSLKEEDRITYYKTVCESIGLNPFTQPFSYLELNKKLVLYANKSCTDQLRALYKISIHITAREMIGDVYVVTARAKNPEGREDESTGVVYIGKHTGDALANLFLKAETKSKRRATLSICGLGLLDESEVDTIPGAQKISHPQERASTSLFVKIDEILSDLHTDFEAPAVQARFKEITGKATHLEWTTEEAEKVLHYLENKLQKKETKPEGTKP